MAFETISANMSLPIPSVGNTSGPTYASDVNSCLTIIDQHNHTPGLGVPVPTSGLSIDADLPFNNVNATNLRSVRFQPQGAVLSNPSDLGCLYEVNDDLYYNDGNGNNIRITENGAVAGTPGSIANLVSPASASYVSATSTFVWQSNTNTPANMDAASYIFRNLVANSKALTLSPPNAMASNYSLVLPALPVQQNIMTLDASGNITAAWNVDNVTLQVQANELSVKNGYITYEFKINGIYSNLNTPDDYDGMCFFNFNAEIVNIWAYSETPGSGGTTTLDLRVATAPGGSFSSILSTKASFTSASAANSYVDANGVVSPGTGVTAPVLTSPNIAAGSAMKLFLNAAMTGTAANCGFIVQFKQR